MGLEDSIVYEIYYVELNNDDIYRLDCGLSQVDDLPEL